MVFIKGPIVMKNPGNVVEAIRKQYGNQQTGSIKLPFVATGWKSTKMPAMDVIGIDSNVAVSHSELDNKPRIEQPVGIVPVLVVEPDLVAPEEVVAEVVESKKKKRRSV